MPKDAQVEAFLAQANAQNAPDMSTLSAAEARANFAGMRQMFPPGPQVARAEDFFVPVKGGQILVRAYVPTGEVRGLMVYYHGGGWVLGSVEDADASARLLAVETKCAVASVDYRLAPEFPFPTPLEDSYAALVWAADNMNKLVGRKVPILVAGESAGGNLAGAMAILARDRKGPKIDLQILLYPVTDSACDTGSYRDFAKEKLLTRDAMKWFWRQYIPDETKHGEPLAAILRTKNLAGLPPALIQTAEFDPLRDEGETYGERLRAAGVAVEIQRLDGMIHGFITFAQLLDGGRKAVGRVADFVAKSL